MKSSELLGFTVNDDGLITISGIPEPTLRKDVFDRVDPLGVHTAHDLIRLIKSCEPLVAHFRRLSCEYFAQQNKPSGFVGNLLDQSGLRPGAQQLIVLTLRRNPEDGWCQWIEFSGEVALDGFLQVVRDWLDEDINWTESEYFDPIWNGQVAAFDYFNEVPARILNAVGIQVIVGAVPGANCQAAYLRTKIDRANLLAQSLDLEFRFMEDLTAENEDSHG